MIRKKTLLTVFAAAILLIAGCSIAADVIGESSGSLENDGGPMEERSVHAQEPSEQQISDVTHYEDQPNQNYTYSSEKIEQQMLERINEFRENNNAVRATHSAALESSASAKAVHMVNNDYYAHTSPNGVGFDEFIQDTGTCAGPTTENLDIARIGEVHRNTLSGGGNLAVVEDVFTAWKNSNEGHREAMLIDGADSSSVEIGVGVYIKPWEQNNDMLRVYVVLHICQG